MNNSYFNYIKTALAGAKYHEDLAFKAEENGLNNYGKILFHLRAYFWELWSVWDYILQEANVQTLGLDPCDVRRTLLKKIKKEMPSYKHLNVLESIGHHERLERIKWLRDHAHKWQIEPYLIDYTEEKINVIALNNLGLKDKNLPRQINLDRTDLWFMQKSVKSLAKEGFFKKA